MAHLIQADDIGQAWRSALQHLRAIGGSEYDLLLDVARSEPTIAGHEQRPLDQFLAHRGWQSIETVANTIFPVAIAATAPNREALYVRYRRLTPFLHRVPANRKGIYFERLIDYPLQGQEDRANQLELIIGDLRGQLAGSGPMRHAYELVIFAPGKDRLPRGFPCLSSVSLHLENRQLRLAATYRNQYYIQKALGNLLGLARLQHWIAREAGADPGGLSMHAFHAQIDPQVADRDVGELLASGAGEQSLT